METLFNEPTSQTPLINFNPISGNLELRGKSTHEDSFKIYQPMFDWLEEYSRHPVLKTSLNIQLDYFNTSSSKCINDLFKKMELIVKNGNGDVSINWLYDELDEDMLEAGEEYKSITKIPFNLVSFRK